MKNLQQILPYSHIKAVHGAQDVMVSGLTLDSRQVAPGNLFAAISGTQVDGHRYIGKAIEAGAVAVLCETLPETLIPGITYIESQSAPKALALMASAFYNHPAQTFDLVGITGTNGKTTTASLLWQLFTSFGYKCGLIGTTGIRIHDRQLAATHTTPDSINLHALFAEMAEAECDFVFMEVSSIAVHQDRVYGVPFKGGIFTNLTHDHLDYHGTFAAYRDAKKAFFDNLPDDAFALTNADDKNGRFMLQNTPAARATYGLDNVADFKAKVVEMDIHGMLLHVEGQEIYTRLTGRFNAYNLLAVYATAILLDMEQEKVLTALTKLTPAEGRFQTMQGSGVTGIVDYAHTPDALENVLKAVRESCLDAGHLITVVGCGGNRDRDKRPVMARIASEYSHQLILTSDNPRNEAPEAILEDMEKGLPHHMRHRALTITDRRQAIRTACRLAKPGDIVLVAGKGHEKYQEINGIRHPFDDMEELRESLNQVQA